MCYRPADNWSHDRIKTAEKTALKSTVVENITQELKHHSHNQERKRKESEQYAVISVAYKYKVLT